MPVIAKLNVANENIEQLDIDNIKSRFIYYFILFYFISIIINLRSYFILFFLL